MSAASGGGGGELALVLHTHMPYVEGYGTWPFGEEWLWEAIATCYLPLLDVLDDAAQRGMPLTLSLTPVLCDQLEAPGLGERFLAFLRDVRPRTHAVDAAGCRETGEPGLAQEIDRSAADYRRAAERFVELGGDLLGALAAHVAWTSSATHAVLPLLATDAGIDLQLETGIASHRERFGAWGGGLWLPECAHAPWLDARLAQAGVRATCVDLTDVLGRGASEHLRPLRTEAGPVLAPIDREIVELVWSHDGYPAHGSYRDYHHHTAHHHRPWSNDGRTYDREAAEALARDHARDFVARVRKRLQHASTQLGGPGLCVCALDTELLGHWWFEGPTWLSAVIAEAARSGLRISALDDALARHEPRAAGRLPVTSWGTPRDLSTWDGPQVAEIAFATRSAELRAIAARARGDASPVALRELLALQASDWAFQVTRELAGDYPRERFAGHLAAFDEALTAIDSGAPGPRNLAPRLP